MTRNSLVTDNSSMVDIVLKGRKINTIVELRKYFSHEIFNYYRDGSLLLWLYTRGYTREYRELSRIRNKKYYHAIEDIVKILKLPEKKGEKVQSEYYDIFYDIRKELYSDSSDINLIKSNIQSLVDNCMMIFSNIHEEFFWQLLYRKKYLAIMCLLMNPETRRFYMPYPDLIEIKNNICGNGLYGYSEIDENNRMYEDICKLVKTRAFRRALGDNLIHVFECNRGARGEWRVIEPKGKKFMIIRIRKYDMIRPAGSNDAKDILYYFNINNYFEIVDGIEYNTDSIFTKIMYMEV